jgi:hypothetical protein
VWVPPHVRGWFFIDYFLFLLLLYLFSIRIYGLILTLPVQLNGLYFFNHNLLISY